jgi:L-fucose isomerase-like protein
MIGLIVLYSSLENTQSMADWKEKYFTDLNILPEITYIGMANHPNQIKSLTDNKLFTAFILLLATGGTEKLAESIIKRFERPVLLWSHPEKNSLAAALEVMGAYKNHYPLLMHYCENKEMSQEFLSFIRVAKLYRYLNNANIGFIGDPSEWLLISQNTQNVPFNMNFFRLETKELIQLVKKVSNEESEQMLSERFSSKIPGCISHTEVVNALKVFIALKKMIDKYQLEGLSLRCFDLLNEKYTACLGLSLLNDLGIPAGCEGDKHAITALMMAHSLTGRAGWMANPSSVSFEENSITFAHCSAPLSFLDPTIEFTFNTHMESKLSVAIEGSPEKREVTVFRLGADFDQLMAVKGSITESNTKNPNLCRTQAKVKLNGKLTTWLENACGNHQIIVYGDITKELKLFCRFQKIQFLEIK